MTEPDIKQEVRHFYDRVGWQTEADGQYQNAQYEDLRPVSQQYIHRCHLRVNRHLKPHGRYLLDAGSGPIQYPEYLTYSEGYKRRVCADISPVALQEARKRLGEHGLYVVADVAHLPFKDGAFDGVVSLHTLHHLPATEQPGAYEDIHRVLAVGCTAVVVNGWTDAPLMRRMERLVKWMENRLRKQSPAQERSNNESKDTPTGTFVQKINHAWLQKEVASRVPLQVYVWRSVSVRFLRAVIHPKLGGKLLLKLLYALEERNPRWFGENGQYPMVVIKKS